MGFKSSYEPYFYFMVLVKVTNTLTFAEADGRKEEIEESLERLEALGFSVNTQLTTGRKDWLGSIIVLTK